MRLGFAAITIFLGTNLVPALRSQPSGEFVFVARRSGIAEVLDAVTLETAARLHLDAHIERASAGPGGATISLASYATGESCCQRYTLDPLSGKLNLQPTDSGRSGYGACLNSPDGRWCFQVKNFRGPALQMVDRTNQETTRELIPPGLPAENSSGNWYAQGVWSAGRFYLYVSRPDDPGFLWTVVPGVEALGIGIPVAPFNQAANCWAAFPEVKEIAAAGGRLFLYEPFGIRNKLSRHCPGLAGGAWVLDPATGQLIDQIAPGLHFGTLLSAASQSSLYGVVPGPVEAEGEPVHLVRLNPLTGQVTKSRDFEAGDVFTISIGALASIPAGDVFAHP